jgi:hypothetical protein
MPQAIARITTFSLLDAIAPNRVRFSVITYTGPAMSATMGAIDAAAAELAAQGPVFPNVPKEAPLPGINVWGIITDQAAYTAAVMARRCERTGQHRNDGRGFCIDCGEVI